MSGIRVLVYGNDGKLLGIAQRPTRIRGVQRLNDVGSWTIELPYTAANTWLHPASGNSVAIWYQGVRLASGPILKTVLTIDASNPAGGIVTSGITDEHLLADRVIYPDPLYGAQFQTTASHHAITGAMSSIIWGYVNAHAGPGATGDRARGAPTMAPDPLLGSAYTASERWRNLLEAIQEYALAGNLRFYVDRAWKGERTFRIEEQRDNRLSAVFSLPRGTVERLVWTREAALATTLIGAGQGDLTARMVREAQDASTMSLTNRRIEEFVDQRNEEDATKIDATLQSKLKESGRVSGATASPARTSPLQYGTDYQIGDWVSVYPFPAVTDSNSSWLMQQQVQEIEFNSTSTGIDFRPTIGPPNTTNTPDDIIAGRATVKRLSQIEEAQ